MNTLSQKIDAVINWMDQLHSNSTETKTPVVLVNEMLDKLPTKIWQDRTKTFLDLTCGRGIFGLLILQRLFNGLQSVIPDEQERLNHILKEQIWMYDISKVMCMKATAAFSRAIKAAGLVNPGVNIYNKDSLEHKFNMKFNVIVGNPPFNPPLSSANGEIIWDKFVIHCWTILSENGYISFVTPTGWRHKSKQSLCDVYKIVTQHAISWSNAKHQFGTSIGKSIDVDWWLVKKQNPIRPIQFLPRSSEDLLAMSIFNKLECFKGKKCVRLQNGFDKNEKSRGTFKLAQTSKHWLKDEWSTCSKKSRTHDARKVIISSSGSTGAIYDDGNCSTNNHSHGIMVTDEKHALSVINTLNSKTARFIAQQLVSHGSLENPLLWIVNMLPDSNDIDIALSLTQEEIAYIESMVK